MICLSRLQNLAKADLKFQDQNKSNSGFQLKYHCTLYNAKNSSFFGRTVKSDPFLDLKDMVRNFTMLETVEE